MEKFSIGRVLGSGFGIWFKNIIPFTAITLLLFSPVIIWSAVIFSNPFAHGETLKYWGLYMLVPLTLIGSAVSAALTYGVVMQLQGSKASIGACIGKGFSRLFPVLGVAIVSGILVGLGCLALIVPGIIIYCMLYVATPVAVTERPGVMASLSRSRELTRGHKAEIFVIFLILMVIGFVVNQLEESSLKSATSMGALKTVLFIRLGAQLIMSTLGSTMVAVAYVLLRREKEGTSVQELAAVFE